MNWWKTKKQIEREALIERLHLSVTALREEVEDVQVERDNSLTREAITLDSSKKLVISRPATELVEPTAEEARGWIGMGVGKYHKAQIIERLEDLKDNWVNGDYTGETTEATIQMNSEALGKAQAYADVLLTLEEMVIEDDEDED